MAGDLSQEEIDQLMSGDLSEERQREVFEEDSEESTEDIEQEEIEETVSSEQPFNDEIVEKDENKNLTKEEKVAAKKKLKEEKAALKKKLKEEKAALKKKSKEEKATSKTNKAETATGEEAKEKSKVDLAQKVNKVPTKILIIVLAVLGVLVLIMGILFGVTLLKKSKLDAANKVKATVPKYQANATNYIFISQEKEFQGEPLKLVKMLIDPVATIFYFDKELNFMNYEVDLTDRAGKSYNMDLSFVEASNSDNSGASFIRFDTIDEGITGFTLTISDPNTGETIKYNIKLDTYPKNLTAKYLGEPVKTKIPNYNMDIVLEDAKFSSSGSIIEYKLNWADNSNAIQMGWEGIKTDSLITLEDGNIPVPATKKYPSMYSFADKNTIIGRMDFDHVRNLNANIEVNFNSLYNQYNLNQIIDVEQLPYEADENLQYIINIGENKLILEQYGNLGDRCILTYHALDTLGNRVEARLSGQLVISDNSGMEVNIDGECIAKKEGGDFIFDLAKSQELIDSLSNKTYKLNLKYAGIKIPEQTVTLDLSQINETTVQTDKKEVENFIKEAFEKRLSVKSGETESSELQKYYGLSILKDNSIITDYLTPIKLTDDAKYSSQILTMAKENDNLYFAAVQDAWNGKDDTKEIHFYRTHKIVIENKDGSWLITEDKIIK